MKEQMFNFIKLKKEEKKCLVDVDIFKRWVKNECAIKWI